MLAINLRRYLRTGSCKVLQYKGPGKALAHGQLVPRRWKVLPPVHQILIGLESAIPFLLLQTSTSSIDSVWNRHQVSQLPSLPLSLSIPPPRSSGDKWGTGYAAGFSVGDHLTAAACWCTHCTSAPPLPHQPRLGRVTSPACCQHRVFEEKTARHVNRFIRFSRFHQGICQYEHPHHRHPPNHNHHDSRPNNMSHSHDVGRSAAGHRDQPLPSKH